MRREFQVVYRDGDPAVKLAGHAMTAVGEVKTVAIICEAEDQARGQFEAAGFAVIAVNFIRAVVDWSLPNLDRDEAAEYLRIKNGTLSINKGAGKIPCSELGHGIYPRSWLDELVKKHANPAGREVAKQLTD